LPLTQRDAGARSIASALDLRAAARAPAVIQAGAPIQGPRVAVKTAYLGYLSSTLLALCLLIAAAAGPTVITAVRRRRAAAAAKDPDWVHVGVVVGNDKAVVAEDR
jgi:hypothetical protein